jgi:hypothetical protein
MGPSVLTLGQLYVILGSDMGLIGVALYRLPPKKPMILLCAPRKQTPRKQRGAARLSAKQRRVRKAQVTA